MKTLGTMLLACLLATGCGKKDDDGNKPAGDKPAGDKPGDNPLAAEAVEPDKKKPAEAPPEAPKKPAVVQPGDIDGTKTVSAVKLVAALRPWKRKTELTVAGYTKFFIGESGKLRGSVEIVATPGGNKDTPVLIRCDLPSPPADELTNKTPLVVKGIISGTWGKSEDKVLSFKKCEIVSHGTEFDAKAPADPNSGKPMPVQAFHDLYFGWLGKEVSVAGYYKGITTSSNKGKILDVRIDLADDKNKKILGCHLEKKKPDEEYTKKLAASREATIVKGVISGEAFGNWQLEPCTIVNR